MRELVLTPEAFDDLVHARRWYEERSLGLGSAFERAVEATLLRVQRLPESFPLSTPPFHRAVLKRYPYDIHYSFDDVRVLIILISHTSRDPGHAAARLKQH